MRRFVVGELDGVELTVLSKEVFIAGDLGLGHLEDGASTDVDEELCSGQRCPLRRAVKVCWAANKSFEVLKFKFKFPRARTFELFRARSRLYRSQILQPFSFFAFIEIYMIHALSHRSKPNPLTNDMFRLF